MHTVIRRAPGVTFIVREDTVVQFGLDATRAGLIHVPNAHAVAEALAATKITCTRAQLRDSLVQAGVSPAAAHRVVEEMLSYGLWRETTSERAIAVIGNSWMAQTLASSLRALGYTVHSKLAIDQEAIKYISSLPRDLPVLLVDALSQAHPLSEALYSHIATWLPITTLDNRVLIGPLHRNGTGPCLMCMNLHRVDSDPLWIHTLEKISSPGPYPDERVLLAAQAYTAVVVDFLISAQPLPGATPVRWLPGEIHEIDIFGLNQHRIMDHHEHCPVCFAAHHSGTACAG